MKMMTVGLLLCWGAFQEDSELIKLRELVAAEKKARDNGDTAGADKHKDAILRALRSALEAHNKAEEAKDEKLQQKTFPRLVEMFRIIEGEAVDPRLLEDKNQRKFLLMALKAFTSDPKTRREEYETALKAFEEQKKKLGVQEGFKAILPERLKEGENGAESYTKAFQQIEKIWGTDPTDEEFFVRVRDRAGAAKDLKGAKEHLERSKPLLDDVREAVRRKGVQFPVDYKKGYDVPLPHIGRLIRLAKVLRGCALASCALGDQKGARESVHLMLRTAACLEDPLLVSALINVVLLRIAHDCLQEICRAEPPPEEDLREFQKDLARLDPRKMFARAYQGEACSAVMMVEDLLVPQCRQTPLGPELETYFRKDVLELLKRYQIIRLYIEEDRPNNRVDVTPLSENSADLPVFTELLLPASVRALTNMIQMEAMVRTASVGLAAFTYHAKNGKWPDKLEDLVPTFLAAIPVDPFSEKALLYRHDRIYSVGPNGRDDGGQSDEEERDKDDIAFRLK